jgi:outer membrane protein
MFPRSLTATTVVVLVLCLYTSLAPLGAQDAPPKIAVVDLDRVVYQSASGKELQARLERFEAEVRSEIQSRTQKVTELRQQLLSQQATLTADQGKAMQQRIEDQLIEIRRYQDDKKREAAKIQERALKDIEQQLKPVFEKIRDERGYDLILNNAPGVVVMVRGDVEITDEVIEKLNSMGSP